MGALIKLIVFSLLLSALIYPGLEKLYLYRQTIKLEDLVMAPLGFLGENQTILANDDKFTRYGTKYSSLDTLPNRDLFIGIKNEFKFHERWVNISEERDRIDKGRWNDLVNLRTKLFNNEYSMVIYGPATDELDLYYIIREATFIHSIVSEAGSNLDNYCEIFLPSAEHRCALCKYAVRVFFRENETCDNVMQDVLDYYATNFYKVCRADELTANFKVRVILAVNGFFISDECNGGGTLLTDYDDKGFRIDDLLNILYLFLLVATLVLFRFKRRLIIYILGILILLWLPLSIFNDNFVSEYSLNESSYTYANKSILDDRYLPQNLKELETIRDASYNKPAVINELSPKNFFPIGRYLNNPYQG